MSVHEQEKKYNCWSSHQEYLAKHVKKFWGSTLRVRETMLLCKKNNIEIIVLTFKIISVWNAVLMSINVYNSV